MDELDRLRREVRRVDGGILELVAERMALVQRIGEVKRGRAIPLRDFAVEKQVLGGAESQARTLGISGELARSVMKLLIGASRMEQERLHYSAYRGEAERVLLIGGRGTMGRWFARFLENQGHRVLVWDVRPGEGDGVPPAATSLAAGLAVSTLAVITAPLERTAEVIEQVAETGYGGTVFDIASLKGHLSGAIARARARGVAMTSIHPMFGAGARTLSDKVVCICDCGDAAATAKVEGLFADTAATLVRLTFEEHDGIASLVLALSHLVNLVFARALTDSGLTLDQLARVGSTTFASQLVTTASVVCENPDLYFSIQRFNPHGRDLYRGVGAALSAVTGSIEGDDREAFARLMGEARAWLETSPAAPER